MTDIVENDLIQIQDPGAPLWDRMVMIVDEIRSWGVLCHADMLSDRRRSDLNYRVSHGSYRKVGTLNASSQLAAPEKEKPSTSKEKTPKGESE